MSIKPVFKRILTKVFCQYILNLISKKKLGGFNDLIISAYFQSFTCLQQYQYGHFLASAAASFAAASFFFYLLSLPDLYRPVLILKSAQHCLYSSGKNRCTQHMWSNDMFVLRNYIEVSSNVMRAIRNEADKRFFRTNWQRCFWYFLMKLAKLHFNFFVSHLISLNY